jgi:formamidase
MDTRDGVDLQIKPSTVASDLRKVDLNSSHALTGPVYVEGAEPGDLLETTVLRIEPGSFGFTAILPGFGLLRGVFQEPYLVKWNMRDGYATSRDLPGVRVPDASFMGVMGVAPSRLLRQRILLREEELRRRGGFVLPPEPRGAVPPSEPFASEGLRTIPPRENGGNMDTKQMTAGVRLLLPVFVEGALFSAGDAHFAQGDGESCGTAIEMSATLHVSFKVRKGEARERGIRMPMFERDEYFTRPEMAAPRRFLATTGYPFSEGGSESEDVTLAARNAILNMIDVLVGRGWSREQAYCICSVAVDLKVSEIVDLPNVMVSAFLPLDIFT